MRKRRTVGRLMELLQYCYRRMTRYDSGPAMVESLPGRVSIRIYTILVEEYGVTFHD